MKLRNTLKRFWTLDVHGHEGFTLVELIVVIAILAILGGVAVPAYGGYVTRANMTADQTLISEVADALTLYYYSHPGMEGGYVILKPNGAPATGDEVVSAAAMEAVFGSSWAETATLKYDEWTDDGLLAYVLQNKADAPLIAGSTFLTTATPEGLMNAVTNLTGAATDVIKNYSGDVEGKLKTLLGEDFVTALNATGVTKDDDEYETVISNMLVGEFAKNMNGSTIDEVMGDQLTGMTLMYAELYAYCETTGDTTTMAGLNQYLSEADDMDELSISGLNNYLSVNANPEFMNGFLEFAGTDENPGQGYKDIEAALEIMGAVNHISGTYSDKATLSNPDLYASDSVAEQLNNYINAVKAVANLDTKALNNLEDGSVAIFIAEDGSVSVVPGAAYLVK